MRSTTDMGDGLSAIRALEARISVLEARLDALETQGSAASSDSGAGSVRSGATAPSGMLDRVAWTEQYTVAQLEVSETWIELHEVSARPQLQRLIRQVVDEEGPVTERLVLDRVRRAWGLRRAGGRVLEAFDQSVRQLLARGLVERDGDALVVPGRSLEAVRVPGDEESSRRAAEDVPLAELVLALESAARTTGRIDEDELTMSVAKLFGWTRRGGAIQERLDAALDRADELGSIRRVAGRVTASNVGR